MAGLYKETFYRDMVYREIVWGERGMEGGVWVCWNRGRGWSLLVLLV